MPLAQEGIQSDPRDPGNYERLIDLYCKTQHYREALAVAEELQLLFEPQINGRTFVFAQAESANEASSRIRRVQSRG